MKTKMKKTILSLNLYFENWLYHLEVQNWESYENLFSYSCKNQKNEIIKELQKEMLFTKKYMNW